MAKFRDAFILLVEGSDPTERLVRAGEMTDSTFVPVPDADTAARVAVELVDDGAELIELYGGLGPQAAAAVIEAIGGAVPVGLVGAKADASVRNRAVVYESPGADPAVDRRVFDYGAGRLTLVGVGDAAQLPATVTQLGAEGVEVVELCGGFGPQPAAAAIAAAGDRIAVNTVLFGFESLPGAAAYRARFEAAFAA